MHDRDCVYRYVQELLCELGLPQATVAEKFVTRICRHVRMLKVV